MTETQEAAKQIAQHLDEVFAKTLRRETGDRAAAQEAYSRALGAVPPPMIPDVLDAVFAVAPRPAGVKPDSPTPD